MIKYIATHPIQYQVPLIRYLSNRIKIKVAYRSNISIKKYHDKDLGREKRNLELEILINLNNLKR